MINSLFLQHKVLLQARGWARVCACQDGRKGAKEDQEGYVAGVSTEKEVQQGVHHRRIGTQVLRGWQGAEEILHAQPRDIRKKEKDAMEQQETNKKERRGRRMPRNIQRRKRKKEEVEGGRTVGSSQATEMNTKFLTEGHSTSEIGFSRPSTKRMEDTMNMHKRNSCEGRGFSPEKSERERRRREQERGCASPRRDPARNSTRGKMLRRGWRCDGTGRGDSSTRGG